MQEDDSDLVHHGAHLSLEQDFRSVQDALQLLLQGNDSMLTGRTLCNMPVIPQLEHERVHSLPHLLGPIAGPLGLPREGEARQ